MDRDRRRPHLKTFWQYVLVAIGVVAIVQELRKPKADRTWHGKVFDVVPYDFRVPTIERLRATYWNPKGPIVSSRVFGVGWAPNFGAIREFLRR